MRIIIISRGIPTKQDSQWGSFEFDQAKALVALGHDVIMVSVDSRFRWYKRKYGLTCEEREGVKLYNYFLCPEAITGLLGEKFKEHCTCWQWKQIESTILKREGIIDIIYSHFLFNTYYVVNVWNRIKAPIVAIEHWSEINKQHLPSNVKEMGDYVYPQVNQLLTVSNAARNSIMQHFQKEAIVVYNMVGDKFNYLKDNRYCEKVRFIAIGSLIHRKGFDILIDAFEKIALPSNTWNLNIIGEGKELPFLARRIAKANMGQNIHLLGSRTVDEIVNFLNQSDVFILPSRMETFGVVYIEAMACGLPVIATPCGGPEEFVTKNNGLLVPVNDIEALAEAIKYMYEHHQDYDHQAIADDCKARFSSEVIAKQLTEIFDDVIAKYKQQQ